MSHSISIIVSSSTISNSFARPPASIIYAPLLVCSIPSTRFWLYHNSHCPLSFRSAHLSRSLTSSPAVTLVGLSIIPLPPSPSPCSDNIASLAHYTPPHGDSCPLPS